MTERILACDLDGVIFKFNDAYCRLFKEMFNLDFPPETNEYPDKWDYDKHIATRAQIAEVWAEINGPHNYFFWRLLRPYEGAADFLKRASEAFSETVFITSRTGEDCAKATEDALVTLGVDAPKVIVAHEKVPHLIHSGATDFLDDRDKNFEDVLLHNIYAVGNQASLLPPFEGKLWILDRPWNRHFEHPRVTRIYDPTEIL